MSEQRTYAQPDRLFFHTKIEGCQLTASTDQAFRILDAEGFQYWVPKSLCREVKFEQGEVYIHGFTYNKILSTAINLATY